VLNHAFCSHASGVVLRGWVGVHGKRAIVSVSTDDAREDFRREYSPARMNWDLRHRKSSLVIRLTLAVWITVLVVVLCATGRWWGLVFVLPLVLDLYLLRRILAAGSGR
jgi:hypothetical protein